MERGRDGLPRNEFMGQNEEENAVVEQTTGTDTPKTNVLVKGKPFGVAMIPTTPVPFTDWQAFVRLATYGTVAYLAWPKAKVISYIAMGAAGISLATSLGANSWKKV